MEGRLEAISCRFTKAKVIRIVRGGTEGWQAGAGPCKTPLQNI
jgi:hypothetical protein